MKSDDEAQYALSLPAPDIDPPIIESRAGLRTISFTLDDSCWSHCWIVLAGMPGEPVITADGHPLHKMTDLEQERKAGQGRYADNCLLR